MNLYNLLQYYLQILLRSPFPNRSKLEEWQQKQIEALLKQVQKKSPYYHRLSLQYSHWQEYPIVEKKQWMQHFDEINTLGITKKNALNIALQAEKSRDFSPSIGKIIVGLSSGTSGNRGLFLVTPKERARWLAYVLHKILSPLQLRRRKIAFFLRANSNLYNSVQSLFFDFCFFDLKNSHTSNIEQLQAYQPHILVAPASVLRRIAQAQQDKKLQIQPEKILSVAEVLESTDSSFIQATFQQIVHQAYQCTEGFLAVTCQYGTLHFNEDVVKIEKQYIDEEKRRYHPIITDFHRIGQPIIRYLLNDIIIDREEPCPCGSIFQAIDHIEGRTDDIFFFQDEKGESVQVYPDFIRRTVILPETSIKEYMVEQINPRLLHIFIQTSNFPEDCQILQNSFTQLLEEYNIGGVELQFFDNLPELKEGKLRRIKCSFSI